MTSAIRRAGHAPLDGDRTLLWTVAEGARGRRWRATIIEGAAVGLSLLLEVGLDGRPSRLEVGTAAGLLTLHPDRGGVRLHGNVATPTGMRHIDLPWAAGHHLDVAGCPLTLAVIAHALRDEVLVGASVDLPVITLGRSLEPRPTVARVDRTSPSAWLLEVDGRSLALDVDDRGITLLPDGTDWPLEV